MCSARTRVRLLVACVRVQVCVYIYIIIPYAVVVALDDLQEHRRPILHVLGEDLQQVAVVIEIDQNVELLDGVEVFHDLRRRALEALPKLLVVRLGHHQEVHASLAQVADLGEIEELGRWDSVC